MNLLSSFIYLYIYTFFKNGEKTITIDDIELLYDRLLDIKVLEKEEALYTFENFYNLFLNIFTSCELGTYIRGEFEIDDPMFINYYLNMIKLTDEMEKKINYIYSKRNKNER